MVETTIPAGMKAWGGGDAAPSDWDGGDVLWSNGNVSYADEGTSWDHDPAFIAEGCAIIAYTPAPEQRGEADHFAGVGNMVPAGWKLVPIVPTEAMVKAGAAGSEYQSYMGHACSSSVRGTYAAMLAVLPDVERRGWRPKVVAFADLMERQLRANDHKPGWKRDDPLDLLDRVVDETEELVRAVRRHIAISNDLEPSRGSDPCWRTGVAHLIGPEAADIANFAMMVADVCGALPDAPAAETPVAVAAGVAS